MASTARSGRVKLDVGGLISKPTPLEESNLLVPLDETPAPASSPTRIIPITPPVLIRNPRNAQGETLALAREIVSENIEFSLNNLTNPMIITTTDFLTEKEFWNHYQKTLLTSIIGTSAAEQAFVSRLKAEYAIEFAKLEEVLKERRNAKTIIDNISLAFDIKNIPQVSKLAQKYFNYGSVDFKSFPETKIYFEILSSVRRTLEGASATLVGEEQITNIVSNELVSRQANIRNLQIVKKIVPVKRSSFETVNSIFSGLTNDKVLRLATALLSKELSVSRALTKNNIKALLREKYVANPDNNPFDNVFGDVPTSIFGLPRGGNSIASKINFKLTTGETIQALESTFINRQTNPTVLPGSEFFQATIFDSVPSIENLIRYKGSFAETVDDFITLYKESTDSVALSSEFLFSRAATSFASSLEILRTEDAASVQRLLFALLVFGIDNSDIKIAVFQLFLLIGIKTVGPDSAIFQNIKKEIGEARNIYGVPTTSRELLTSDNIMFVARSLGFFIENKINEILLTKNTEINPSVYTNNIITLTPGTVVRLIEYAVDSPANNVLTAFAEFLIDCDFEAGKGLGSDSLYLGPNYGRESTYTKLSNVSSTTVALLVFELAQAFVSKYINIEITKTGPNIAIGEESNNSLIQERFGAWVNGDKAADAELTRVTKALQEENGFIEDFIAINTAINSKITRAIDNFRSFVTANNVGSESIAKNYKSILSGQYEILNVLRQKTEKNKNNAADCVVQIFNNYRQLLKADFINKEEQALIVGIPIGFSINEKREIFLNTTETKARNFGDFIKLSAFKKNAITNIETLEKTLHFDLKLTIELPVDRSTFSLAPNGLLTFLKQRALFNRKERRNLTFAEYKQHILVDFGVTNAEELVTNHFVSDYILGFYSCLLSSPAGINELTFLTNKKFKTTPEIPKNFISELRATRPELFLRTESILPEVKFDRVLGVACGKTSAINSSIETIYIKLDMVA